MGHVGLLDRVEAARLGTRVRQRTAAPALAGVLGVERAAALRPQRHELGQRLLALASAPLGDLGIMGHDQALLLPRQLRSPGSRRASWLDARRRRSSANSP